MKRSTLISIVAGALLVGAGGQAVKSTGGGWVFSRPAMAERISAQTGFRLEADKFQTTWFPPGFVAENVRLYDPAIASKNPILQAANLRLEGSYSGLLQKPHRIARVSVQGAKFWIPQKGAAGGGHRFNSKAEGVSGAGGTSLALDNLLVENSTLDIAQDGDVVRFAVKKLELRDLGKGDPMAFSVAMTNPKPQGDIHSRGSIGPWNAGDVFATPVSGTFTFQHADLTLPNAISGFLSAQGKFEGQMRSIRCTGSADVPDFLVHASSHPAHVAADFDAVVDARNGNVSLPRVVAHFRDTTITAAGAIKGPPDRAGEKITELELRSTDGHVQDLLSLFTKKDPAMQGGIRFSAKFHIPPGEPDFLTRLAVEGDFDISEAHFTNPKTQAAIARLSGSAEGEKKDELFADPPKVRGHLKGHVSDASALARLKHVEFEAPGMRGQVEGTFNLHSKAMNMAGAVETKGKISDTVKGGKALLAKLMSPLLKKHAAVTTVPFRIGGVASHPVFRVKF